MCKYLILNLKKKVKDNLDSLKNEAEIRGLKLTQNRGSKNICVKEAFNIYLDTRICYELSSFLLFKNKYKEHHAKTVLDLIEFCGGLVNIIDQLQKYRIKWDLLYSEEVISFHDGTNLTSILIDEIEFGTGLVIKENASVEYCNQVFFDGNEEQEKIIGLDTFLCSRESIDYMSTLEFLLIQAKGLTAQSDKKTNPFQLPFCAFCWRRTHSSQFYCLKHHSSRNKKEYNLSLYKVISAVEKYIDNPEDKEDVSYYKEITTRDNMLGKKLYRWTSLFSKPLNRIGINKNKLDTLLLISLLDYLINTIRLNYSKAYEIIVFPITDDMSSLSQWIIECTKSIDKAMGEIEFQNQIWTVWFKSNDEASTRKDSQGTICLIFLNMISRLEAKIVIDSYTLKFGPDKGYRIDHDLRETIFSLRNKQLIEKGKINQAEIARSLGISRQRVHKILKELNE